MKHFSDNKIFFEYFYQYDSVMCYVISTNDERTIISNISVGFLTDYWSHYKNYYEITDVVLYKGTNYKKSLLKNENIFEGRMNVDYPMFTTFNFKREPLVFNTLHNGKLIVKRCRIVLFEKCMFEEGEQ